MSHNYFGTQNGVKPDVPKRALMTLADCIIQHNALAKHRHINSAFSKLRHEFTDDQLATIADFCRKSNPAFDRDRFLDYIAGTRTANGAIPWHLQVPKNAGRFPLSPAKALLKRMREAREGVA